MQLETFDGPRVAQNKNDSDGVRGAVPIRRTSTKRQMSGYAFLSGVEDVRRFSKPVYQLGTLANAAALLSGENDDTIAQKARM
jgi:hypothetical protein